MVFGKTTIVKILQFTSVRLYLNIAACSLTGACAKKHNNTVGRGDRG